MSKPRWSSFRPSQHRELLTHLESTGRLTSPGVVVVLADRSSGERIRDLQSVIGETVHVVAFDDAEPLEGVSWHRVADDAEASRVLALIGCITLIDDATDASSLERMLHWEWAFFHLTHGGLYVAPESTSEPAWVTGLDVLGGAHRSPGPLRALTDASGRRETLHGHVLFPKSRQQFFKVREGEANEVLPSRVPGSSMRILAELPKGAQRDGVRVVQHGLEVGLPRTRFSYAARSVRRFDADVTVRSHGLATIENTVLPSSFRQQWSTNDVNVSLRNVSSEFAVLREPDQGVRPVHGSFYDVSATIPGHFGHFMTESVAKLWGWDDAKADDPELKALYRLPDADYEPVVERAVLNAYGIGDADIEWVSDDILVSSFVGASMLWQNIATHHFHPAIRDTWSRLRTSLVREDPSAAAKLFVSRRYADENRACRNLAEVEAVFASHGFTIVNPENLSPQDQANLFGNADVVAGFAGSAMFNVLYSGHLSKLIVLSHDSYTARNELLYGAALADEVHYFWSKADLAHPGKFSEEAFHSSWDFDFSANGTDLDQLLKTT